MSKVFIEDTTLTAIGDAIRGKTGTSDLIDPANMAQEITNLSTGGGIDPSAFIVKTNCNLEYFNYQGRFDNLIAEYGNLFQISNPISLEYSFENSSLVNLNQLTIIGGSNNVSLYHCFNNCRKLETLPNMTNLRIQSMNDTFTNCNSLEEIAEGYTNSWDFSSLHQQTGIFGAFIATFNGCHKLKYIDSNLLSNLYSRSTRGMANCFCECYSLKQINGLYPSPANYTSNMFYNGIKANLIYQNSMLHKFTFALDENQLPFERNWKEQSIHFEYGVGYVSDTSIKPRVSFAAEKQVTDADSYNLLKNDPDYWTEDSAYSHYNHNSAVETINSLPNCSSSGGTNTITFLGVSGSATDGGAINTLTEEEIAVATAKGWTVSLV